MFGIWKGIFLAAFAGCCWGTMGVAAQYLFENCRFEADDLTALRLIGAGILLLLISAVSEGPRGLFLPFKDKRNIRDILIYGVGVLLIQYTFFIAIHASNAGTAAIMVGFGPLMIMFYMAAAKHRLPSAKELFCLVLAVSGVALLVTKGNFDSLDIASAGAFWGIVSAAFGAFCTVQPKAMIERIGVSLVVGWGMVVGGTVACFFTDPFSMDVDWTWASVGCYLFIIAFGTVAAFWCYLRSTMYVIPSISAILGSFEPFSAVLFSFLILHTTFNSYELLGAAAIITNMLILVWPDKNAIKKLSAEKSQ